MHFDIGATYLLEGDDITIDKIRGTSDRIEAGNLYEVKGTYKLASHDKAMLAAFTTSSQGKGIPTQKTQTTTIEKGSGHFTVYQYIWSDGNPHISFYPAEGGDSFAAVYFGTGRDAAEANELETDGCEDVGEDNALRHHRTGDNEGT